jgi:hypothetical protein
MNLAVGGVAGFFPDGVDGKFIIIYNIKLKDLFFLI